MKLKTNPFLRFALAAAASAFLPTRSAHAVDYNFGTITENFTLTATDQARAFDAGTASGVGFNDNGFGAVYDRGANQDATYFHFDLSSLAGGTINGTVNLNLTIDATYGGAINGGIVGSATNAWSYPGTTGGITTISGADPSGNYSNGQTATAVIDNTTFQGFATSVSTFNGLAITAGDGSTAHFSGPATLTGNATTGLVRVFGGTDWSAAAWNNGTSTLAISGASDVSGGAVTVRSGATVAVTDSATLGAGSFSGTFANSGILSFGSSANQTLSGAISGGGSLSKSGAGTLTLGGDNSYTGGTTIDFGTLVATRNKLGTGAVVINNGGTLYVADQWVLCGVNDHGVAERNIGTLTINAGGTLQFDAVQGFANGVTNLYLNGGLVTGGPNNSRGDLYLYKGNEQITAGGGTTSTIASVIGVSDNNNTITVDTGSTLSVTGLVKNSDWTGSPLTGGFIKAGAGTLTLSAANTYTGQTNITAGTLVAANSTALGAGGFNGTSSTNISDGATLAFQGNVNLDEHMHLTGAGVGGFGALRNLSGDNALTMTNGNSGTGPGLALDGNTTIGVDAGTLTVTGFYHDSGSRGITKVGAGTLTFSSNSTYTGGTTISEGTVITGGGGLGQGAVTVASGATLSTTSASSTGLAALYYNNGSINQADIASLSALLNHFGSNSPAPSLVNTATTMNFANNGSGFPSPYNSGASNFEAFYSGKVNIGTAGTYTFNTSSDDGSMLFIDGVAVVTNNNFQGVTTQTGSIALSSGMHDIVIAFNQGGGGYGMNAQMSGADNGTMVDINTGNANITPDLVVGSLAGAGNVTLSTGNLITGIDNSSTNFSGVISGSDISLTKFGTGTQTLSGTNTYTGATKIIAGTLQLGDGGTTGSLSTSSAITNNGNLTINRSNAVTQGTDFSGAAITGSGTLTHAGTGTTTLNAANTYTGLTTVSNGTLKLQGAAFSTTARTYAIATGAVLNLDGNTGVASGITTIDGTGTLRITGGTFANESPNTPVGDDRDISMELDSGAVIDVQTGATMYNGGWQNVTWTNNKADLKADGTFNLADGNPVFVDALTGAGSVTGGSGTLTVGVDNGSGTFSGVLTGGMGLTKNGTDGTGTQTLSGTISYTGATTVNNGTLVVSGQSYFNIGRTTTVATGAVFELYNSNNSFNSLMPTSTVTGAGTFRLSGNSTISQDNNGSNGDRLTFAMDSGGLIDLQGTSRLTNGGWQEVKWTNNKADMNIASGATLDVWDGQDVIIDALTGSGTVDKVHGGNSPSLLKIGVDNGSGTFSGTIQNSANQIAITKTGTGTQTFSGTNSYTGATIVNGGKLVINGNNSAATGTITVGAGTVTGTPVATLAGSGTGSNGTIGGNVSLAAESSSGFQNGGVLAPTAAASGTKLSVAGTTSFGTGSIFEWDLNAATSDTGLTNQGDYGQLAGTGTISGSDAVFQVVLGSNAFTDAFWDTDKTWNNVFSGAGATNTLASIFSSIAGTGIIYDNFTLRGNVATEGYFTLNGTSSLNWTAVPEPTSALAGLLIAAGLLRRRR